MAFVVQEQVATIVMEIQLIATLALVYQKKHVQEERKKQARTEFGVMIIQNITIKMALIKVLIVVHLDQLLVMILVQEIAHIKIDPVILAHLIQKIQQQQVLLHKLLAKRMEELFAPRHKKYYFKLLFII